ncbi:MAG: hypothetical protein RL030_2343, partial [Pseudomonadota bacterium]
MEVLRAIARRDLKFRVFAAGKAAGLALMLSLAGCNDSIVPLSDGGSAIETPVEVPPAMGATPLEIPPAEMPPVEIPPTETPPTETPPAEAPPVEAPEAAPPTGTATVPEPQPDPVADALPLLSITTDDGKEIYSKEDYQAAHFRLTDENGTVLAENTLEIRGRGNTTWGYPKKPYKLKLTSSTSLLGMPANKHWALLANYLDKTLLRNEAAFHFSEQLGMAWTPRSVEVVVELNGT